MNSTINFLYESGVSLALLATLYILLLRKETYFRINRIFLLGSVLFSVILPFLKFRIYEPKSVMLSEITVTPYKNLLETVTIYSNDLSGAIEHAIISANFLIIIYLSGVIFLLFRFVIRIIQLTLLIRKNPVQVSEGFKLIVLEKELSPFSFLDYIFIGKNTVELEGHERMLLHEIEHIKQGHTFDVIILEVLTIFQWFNPFMWILRHAIRENHEYLADQAVLTSGISRGKYKKLLLNQFVGNQLVIANNFNYSLIKKRIKMMSKMKSSKLAISKLLFGFVLAAALIIAFACEQKEVIETNELNSLLNDKQALPLQLAEDEKIFTIVEEMPEFPGGNEALRAWLSSQVDYPKIAREKGIMGKVYVTFVIAKDGSVANVNLARGVDPSLDKEALRVVNDMPKWKPGFQRDVAVNVSYTVPINFVLQ